MTVATLAKARNGFWVPADGAEFPLIFAGVAIVATLTGPGQWEIDHLLHLDPRTWETLAAITLGAAMGMARSRFCARPDPSQPDHPSARHSLRSTSSNGGEGEEQMISQGTCRRRATSRAER